jgi:hypothetical protein
MTERLQSPPLKGNLVETNARLCILALGLAVLLFSGGCEANPVILSDSWHVNLGGGDPAGPPKTMMFVVNELAGQPDGGEAIIMHVYWDGEVIYVVPMDERQARYLNKRLSQEQVAAFKTKLERSYFGGSGEGYCFAPLVPFMPIYRCVGMDAFAADYGLALSETGAELTAEQEKEFEVPRWVLAAQGYSVATEPNEMPDCLSRTQESLKGGFLDTISRPGGR